MSNTTTKTPVTSCPQEEAYLRWFNQEKESGLVDVNFFKRNVADSTSESFFEEANAMLAAEEVEDKDLS
jgi:hypothetical protein